MKIKNLFFNILKLHVIGAAIVILGSNAKAQTSLCPIDQVPGKCSARTIKNECAKNPMKIGDILLEDKTHCDANIINKLINAKEDEFEKPMGIIVELSGEKALAISLIESAPLKWSEEKFDVPCLTNIPKDPANDKDGKTNSQCINETAKGRNKTYPAASYCYEMAPGKTNIGEWYLPAAGEAYDFILNQQSTINESAKKIRSKSINRTMHFWTSTQVDKQFAWRLHAQGGHWGDYSKSNIYQVRCLYEFDAPAQTEKAKQGFIRR